MRILWWMIVALVLGNAAFFALLFLGEENTNRTWHCKLKPWFFPPRDE